MRLALLVPLLIAAPVSAQRIGPPAPRAALPPIAGSASPAPGSWRDIDDVRDRIRDGRRGGQLSRREARGLRRETDQTGVLADRYAADGLSDAEARELDSRTRVLRDQVNVRRTQNMQKISATTSSGRPAK